MPAACGTTRALSAASSGSLEISRWPIFQTDRPSMTNIPRCWMMCPGECWSSIIARREQITALMPLWKKTVPSICAPEFSRYCSQTIFPEWSGRNSAVCCPDIRRTNTRRHGGKSECFISTWGTQIPERPIRRCFVCARVHQEFIWRRCEFWRWKIMSD